MIETPMDSNMTEPTAFTPAELAQRRRAAKRLAWLLGGVVLILYSVALWLPR
jgi:hypothetical protein